MEPHRDPPPRLDGMVQGNMANDGVGQRDPPPHLDRMSLGKVASYGAAQRDLSQRLDKKVLGKMVTGMRSPIQGDGPQGEEMMYLHNGRKNARGMVDMSDQAQWLAL